MLQGNPDTRCLPLQLRFSLAQRGDSLVFLQFGGNVRQRFAIFGNREFDLAPRINAERDGHAFRLHSDRPVGEVGDRTGFHRPLQADRIGIAGGAREVFLADLRGAFLAGLALRSELPAGADEFLHGFVAIQQIHLTGFSVHACQQFFLLHAIKHGIGEQTRPGVTGAG